MAPTSAVRSAPFLPPRIPFSSMTFFLTAPFLPRRSSFSFSPALNPDPRNSPVLDPKDQALLLDPPGSALDFGRHHGHGGHGSHHVSGGTPPMPAHVPWLRKTEYISRDSSAPAPRPAAADMFVLIFLCPSPLQIQMTQTFSVLRQSKLSERNGGHIARVATRLHREFFRGGTQRRTTRLTATPNQTASARRRGVRGPSRCGRVGERVRSVPVQRAARRARARGALHFCGCLFQRAVIVFSCRSSWMIPGWTVRLCAPWSRMAITSSRTISQRKTTPPNNSKIREQTHAVSSLYKKRKRCVSHPNLLRSRIHTNLGGIPSHPTGTGD